MLGGEIVAIKTKYLIGERFFNSRNQEYEIIGYTDNNRERVIRFIDSGIKKKILIKGITRGSVRDFSDNSILGVGVPGMENASNHFLFDRWMNMIGRCYYKKHCQYKNYGAKGIIVEDYLLNFKNYIDCVSKLENYDLLKKYPKIYQIDKDILSINEKIYSRETLRIVTLDENLEEENKKRRFEIDRYSLDGNYIDTFESITKAEKITGIHRGNIARNVRNEGKSAGGYIWKRKEQE
jgi:hypothetical protein